MAVSTQFGGDSPVLAREDDGLARGSTIPPGDATGPRPLSPGDATGARPVSPGDATAPRRGAESPAGRGTAYLEGLADALTQRGLRARLMTPHGRVPSLHVVHPLATALAEDIYTGRGQDGTWWFWWSWAERIGRSEDVDSAAARIARVLAPRD